MTKKINYKILATDLLTILFSIIFGIFLFLYLKKELINIIACSLWVGFWLHSLFLFIHEGAHFNLHENKKINDFFSNILSLLLMGSFISSYREKHWKHHQNLGLSSDPENSYFFGFSQIFTKFLFFKIKSMFVSPNKFLLKNLVSKMVFIFFHLLILNYIYSYYSFSGLIFYFFTFFFLCSFAIFRQIIEHRSFDANLEDFTQKNHGVVNRLFGRDFFSRFFGAAGFNRHLLHHMRPTISYTCFDDLENEIIKNKKYFNYIKTSKTTYYDCFKKLINTRN